MNRLARELLVVAVTLGSALPALAADPPPPVKPAGPPPTAPAPMAAPAKPAGPAPAAEELKRAMDYYYNGKGRGPILVEFKTCLKIDNNKESPTHYECVEPVSGPVKKGSLVHAWTLWFVPQGDKYDDVVIQFVFEGQIRSTQDIQLTDSFRSRTYRASPLSKAGKWEVKIVRGTTELASLPVTVE